ncbi:MAG: Bug family tripartite tricarboxylate transporter substrate binding protein [Beijerinckiaceae bacterium]
MKTWRSACLQAALAAAIATVCASVPALAQDFYKDRTFRVIVGSSAGGGYDAYARLVARHIGKYIPGNPVVVVSNMPGAGGNNAAAYVYSAAPKDGTVMGAVAAGSVLDKVIGDAKRVRHDPAKMQYIGSANSEMFTCVVRSDAPVKSFKQALSQEVVIGSSGGTTRDMATMMNSLLGTKFRLVAGYKGTRQINLAIEKGEVQGVCGMGWTSIQKQNGRWFEEKFARVLVQEGQKPLEELTKMGAAFSLDYAKDKQTRDIMELIYLQGVFTRPFMMAPEAPKDRVEIIRTAFMKALADPKAHEEAGKQSLVINAISGKELQEMVRKIYAMDPALHAKARQALGY